MALTRKSMLLTGSGLGLACLAAIGWYFGGDTIKAALTDDTPSSPLLPTAAPLSAEQGETLLSIDPSQSSVTVEVEEQLAGTSTTARLSSSSIDGDIALNTAQPARSRIGEIAVNLEYLTSDNALRDKLIRVQYLESSTYPIARLTDATVTGLDAITNTSQQTPITVKGQLLAKRTTNPSSWEGWAMYDGAKLTAHLQTTVELSSFEAGPISKVGLVSTGDNATLTIDLVAVAPDTIGEYRVATAANVTAAGAPSFSNEIAPILTAQCSGCHHTGELGAGVWKLDTAGDAQAIAKGIGLVTRTKYMPPWPPSDFGVPVRHTRTLSAEQLDLLTRWADAGGPLDVDPSSAIPLPANPEVVVPDADQELPLPETFPGVEDPDHYQCFILDPNVTETQYLTGYRFEPDNRSVVHHVLTYRVRADRVEQAREQDASDPLPGWECAAGGMSGGAGGELVAGWVPGQRPRDFGNGYGFKFSPGDVLVQQVHYHYDDGPEPDRSRLILEWSNPGDKIEPIHPRTLIGPVELPCPAGSTEPLCDRDNAIADINRRFGPGGGGVANGVHILCGSAPADVAARSDGTTGSTVCDYPIGARGGYIVDFLGHMHTIGKSYRMTLNPGTPEEKVLLDIPVWNFDWQLNYQPVEPIQVKPGDKVRVECTWDRRTDPGRELRYVLFAEGTEDEMCFSTIATVASLVPQNE